MPKWNRKEIKEEKKKERKKENLLLKRLSGICNIQHKSVKKLFVVEHFLQQKVQNPFFNSLTLTKSLFFCLERENQMCKNFLGIVF